MAQEKEVKVIPINRDTTDKILARKRPTFKNDYTKLVLQNTRSF